MFPAQEKILWKCWANSIERSYQVEELDRKAESFLLDIYARSEETKTTKIDTIQIAVDESEDQIITGSGQTLDGKNIAVKAFGGTLSFRVENSQYGTAIGRCNRTHVETN